ncbi:PHB depolymerase family esterase [Venustampulla echinocandica]|uniref:Carboxylic ester hydrolase n=1 Tax=Venustampulla echinocandica TaxID=2656787 RepID=A0A370T8Q3_9HELO|nr:PHB depolymerase family esterase [Venustampulla echinocandica]RDL29806.1 PHB depolymerase family esterase [Venustampulla echinocandica]
MLSSFKISGLAALSLLSLSANGALVSVPNFGANPTNLLMNIYVPSKLATNPAIILALHGCSGTGEFYASQTKYNSLADTHGFITIFPSANHDNGCWDVASTKTLTHGGGGDSNGLANMISYTISKYNADPKKVFVTGTSSGSMMTNVLAATYPDVFAAASGYSGVAAGCLAGSPSSSPQAADPTCANGKVIKTSAEWTSVVKAMYPGYSGAYPRIQLWHGTADTFVSYANLAEAVKEWSGVIGLTFTKNVTNTPQSGYTQMVYGDGTRFIAYSAAGVGHTVPVHEDVDLKWFGIV